MSGGLVDKVYIGLDNAPAAFDIKGRILGPNGTNLEYIRSETGVIAVLKGDKLEPLHLALHHTRSEALAAARSLAQNLIETIRAELAQWSAAQAGGPPPALNVPPPALATTSAPPPVPPPAATPALSTPPSLTSTAPTVMPPVVSVASASTPLMTVRQPTVLQLLPQQQYVYNQENGQLIPIVQPGVQVSNANFTSLPIAQHIGLQQPNFGTTQIVDISNMQPVNVTQLRLSGVPSSMSMILPNGLTFPQASLTSGDTTTVSSATSTPVVCAAQSTNSAQKFLYSSDKDKDVKYHIQGADTVQWTVPGSQTMLIPYQQLQDFSNNQQGLTNLQPQQYVSIAPASGLPQTSLPLTAAQLQQLQTGAIMQLNQKPIASSGSLINIISTGQASSPHIISNASTPTKHMSGQEARGQKRLSDGTPSQLQLRPIAPAGSHVSQDKGSSRDTRSWTAASGRDNTVVSMGMKINPAHGTIIHVSSGQQTNVSASGLTHDGTGMYIRQIDKNAIHIQSSKDNQKQDLTKVQSTAQNVQMITVPQGMTVLQNHLNIGQMPTVLGQPNSQVYMIPANHPNLVQGALSSGLIGQQVLQPGQNVTVMQPNQLGVPGGVQYNVPIMPMNMQANSQYMSTGLNLNTQLSAQQLNAALAGHQLNPNLAVSGSIPVVQAPPPSSPMTNPTQIPVSQPPPVHQIVPQNSFMAPTSQYSNVPQQYMMQNSGALGVPANNPNVQYSIPNQNNNTSSAGNGQSAASENEPTNGNSNQANYITSSSQDNGYSMSGGNVQNPQQNFSSDGATTQTGFAPSNQTPTPSYGASNGNQNATTYVSQATTAQPPPNYPTNGSNPQTPNQNYGSGSTNSQNTSQANFSPSTTPAPNQSYPTPNLPNMPNVGFPPNQNQQNPYPNATGQNLAAYASNQYQYTSRPWFRPRYGSPQGSPYSSGAGPPPNGPPMPVPPPSGSYNYWQDS